MDEYKENHTINRDYLDLTENLKAANILDIGAIALKNGCLKTYIPK